MIGCCPVFQTVYAAGILRQVASDCAGWLAGRIGNVVQTKMRNGARDMRVDDAWLDDDKTILRIDL